ncbi:MAG: hypothetical protein FJ123_00690 [Deltaproteobacteria bacterium]|nr:hypothetical protein [Deltaproteobacteria bacterium]
MKCEEIDLLEYIEGTPPHGVKAHIEICKKCRRESERLIKFSRLASTRYSDGKKAEQELEDHLGLIDCSRMERLPYALQKKIAEIKERSLVSKIKKVIAKAGESEERLIEKLRSPRLQMMPASPKDITKSKKSTRKKKKRKTP